VGVVALGSPMSCADDTVTGGSYLRDPVVDGGCTVSSQPNPHGCLGAFFPPGCQCGWKTGCDSQPVPYTCVNGEWICPSMASYGCEDAGDAGDAGAD
jgi:hypothetical protein